MADLSAGRAFNGLNPYNFPELYECIILGTTKSPGIVRLSGHDRNENWDVQKAKGAAGATSKLNGQDLAEFQATFTLSADSDDDTGNNDFTRWEAFQDLIDSTVRGPTPKALPIYHPDLARQGIVSVVKRACSGMVHNDDGTAIVVVKFGEHNPEKPKTPAKAKASTMPTTGYGTRVKEDPNAKAKEELAALTALAKKPRA